MNIKNVVFCENMQSAHLPDGSELTILINPIAEMNLAYIPTTYTFYVSFGVCDFRGRSSFAAQISFLDPHGQRVQETKLEITVLPDVRTVTCSCDFRNVPINEPGTYQLIIEIPDAKAETSIEIRLREK